MMAEREAYMIATRRVVTRRIINIQIIGWELPLVSQISKLLNYFVDQNLRLKSTNFAALCKQSTFLKRYSYDFPPK